MSPLGMGHEDVDACLTRDEVVRQVVFGDPAMHIMSVYARRIGQVEMAEVRTGELRRRVGRRMAVRKVEKGVSSSRDRDNSGEKRVDVKLNAPGKT